MLTILTMTGIMVRKSYGGNKRPIFIPDGLMGGIDVLLLWFSKENRELVRVFINCIKSSVFFLTIAVHRAAPNYS